MANAIFFLTGSSGSGKTSLLNNIAKHLPSDVSHHHIDDGNITLEKLVAIAIDSSAQIAILEGSKKPTDVLDAAKMAKVSRLKIVLIDCEREERKRRLVEVRKQPELDNFDIYAWAAYLRGQADALGLEVFDTTSAVIEENASELLISFHKFYSGKQDSHE